ncbi:MAG: conserved hypothetical rane protein [Thermoleophilia bacterium]|nr:conserved hypothetical rane protein [Thermoleophilia bacterium]
MGRITRGWNLAKLSWGVLQRDRSLAWFPILSSIASFIAVVAVAIPGYLVVGLDERSAGQFVVGALIAFVATFVAIYFNVALVSCARRSFEGADTTVAEGLEAANGRLGVIFRWALLATTVGLLLRLLEERLPLAGRIAVWIVGAAWTVATYFVVPVLAFEEVGPIDALKRSGTIVRKNWGEAVIGNVGISAAVFLVSVLVALPLGVLGMVSVGTSVGVLSIVLFVLAAAVLLVGAIVGSTLTQIFNTALYAYANTGTVPGGFDAGDMRAAFTAKKRGGLLG